MRVISKKALADFWSQHPAARAPLGSWYRIVVRARFRNFADVRGTFNSADKVGDYVVFDGGSHRIVVVIHYNREMLFIRHVFTHAQYDNWTKRMRQLS